MERGNPELLPWEAAKVDGDGAVATRAPTDAKAVEAWRRRATTAAPREEASLVGRLEAYFRQIDR